ncbi:MULTISPECIES: hypothetical protein [unclassified Streptomyces]|uniref:hypothetical protein n=1 Tax=unclassified Streptomyces TaxID=2593676 RepID=UPI002E798216|nr:hypothetical protein [Streptomyces sp. SP18ES09]MEE1815599.1 hypothetical protein [Streptomyces sp. SP18ES09]
MRSLVYDNEFRARARRTQGWGLGLLTLAGLLWVWCGVLLLTPYEDADGGGSPCPALVGSDYVHEKDCVASRDWPGTLAVLGGSVPLAVVGAVLYTSGAVSHRMAEHLAEINRLDRASD